MCASEESVDGVHSPMGGTPVRAPKCQHTGRITWLFALKGQPDVSPGQSETAQPCSAALGLVVHGKQALKGRPYAALTPV